MDAIRQQSGIVFRPRGGGVYEIATEEQKYRRGRRFANAAARKLARAAEIVASVNEDDIPAENRDALRRSKEKIASIASLANARGTLRADPETSSLPAVPRGMGEKS